VILFGDDAGLSKSTKNFITLPKDGETISVIPTCFLSTFKAEKHKSKILKAGQSVQDYFLAAVDVVQLWLDPDDYKKRLEAGEFTKEDLYSPYPTWIYNKKNLDTQLEVGAWIVSQENLEPSIPLKTKFGSGIDQKRERYMSVLVKEGNDWVEGVLNFSQNTIYEAFAMLDAQAEDDYGIFGKPIKLGRVGTGNKTKYTVSWDFGGSQREVIKDIKIETPSYLYINMTTRDNQIKMLNAIGLEMPALPANRIKDAEAYDKSIGEFIALKNGVKEIEVEEVEEETDAEGFKTA